MLIRFVRVVIFISSVGNGKEMLCCGLGKVIWMVLVFLRIVIGIDFLFWVCLV